jgi:glycerophosphoryl diester phosphodiesterase
VTFVSAHRGGDEAAPRGSLEAYRTALEMGVELVEVDIRRRPDGVFVCAHDLVVEESPLLAEVLALVVAHGAGAHVDLKEGGYEADLVAFVHGFDLARAYFTIGDVASVRALRAAGGEALLTLGPAFRGRPVWDGIRDFVGAALPFWRIATCDARGVAAQFRFAGPVLRWWCRRRGLALLVWTVNDDRRLRYFLGMPGVTAVVTDRPRRALDLR